MSFGQNLKNLRCAKLPPLTQTDLANAIGVTQRKISFLETGASEPSLKDIAALCRYFNVSADFLLGLPRNMDYPEQLGQRKKLHLKPLRRSKKYIPTPFARYTPTIP